MDYLIALGGNVGDPSETFSSAVHKINEFCGRVLKCSKWIENCAFDPSRACWRSSAGLTYNRALLLDSELNPYELLAELTKIEISLGRGQTQEHYPGQRGTIDLDIIAAENLVVDTEELKIPHPEMHKRAFVLEPLKEIAPNWRHPLCWEKQRPAC